MGKQLVANRLLLSLLTIAILLGLGFHSFNLERKVYWHDEVYTTLRAAGYTRGEIDQELFQNQILPAQDLQKFQRLKPGSSPADTIRSLAVEDPQHPPLYFLISRFWMQAFGSSLSASRSLPVLFSLLGWPLMYWLALELFSSRLAALLATSLLALSPFDTLFAQTARQYSLLTTMTIASSLLLMRALRSPSWLNWGLYALGSAVGLYTHPFFALSLFGHGAYVLLLSLFAPRRAAAPLGVTASLAPVSLNGWWTQLRPFWQYLGAMASTLALYSPWAVVLKTNYARIASTTDWARFPVEFSYLVKLWILSFTSLFLDLDFGLDSPWTYVLRLPFVLLIGVALYAVCRRTRPATWLFILTAIFIPFLMLVLPDLIQGGKRSAVSRYLISCFPGVQLAVAYLLATLLHSSRWLGRSVLALVLSASVISCSVSTFADTWWSKDLSYSNGEVARLLNAEAAQTPAGQPPSLVLSDIGDDYTNTGDLISLSYNLNSAVQLLLLGRPADLTSLQNRPSSLVFRPSEPLWTQLKQDRWQPESVFQPGRLWRIRRP